jgi:hypothetical protein
MERRKHGTPAYVVQRSALFFTLLLLALIVFVHGSQVELETLRRGSFAWLVIGRLV